SLAPGEAVYKSTLYAIKGGVSAQDCERIARDALANELIERWVVKSRDDMKSLDGTSLLDLPLVTQQSSPEVHRIDLELPDGQLVQLSRDRMFALELHEMKAIQAHFRDPAVRAARTRAGLSAEPTDIE